MLTAEAIKSADGAAKYFSKEDGYYLSEKDAKDNSMWYGKGAKIMELSGKIDEKKLNSLFKGELPDGRVLGVKRDGKILHRAGFDLSFSAPKSVSILALVGGDKRLLDAHKKAVLKTIDLIEKDASQTRIFEGNSVRYKNTENLIAGLVTHSTSRNLDPQLHTHSLIMNLTHHNEKGWRSMASCRKQTKEINGFLERVRDNKIYYGVVYRSELAKSVQELGFDVESTAGKNGLWEIKGVPLDAKKAFSTRRKEIEDDMERSGFKGARAAAYSAVDTRAEKNTSYSLEELKAEWGARLGEIGFNPKKFIENREIETPRRQTERPVQAVTAEQLKKADYAINDAISHLSRFQLKLDYNKVMQTAMEFSFGNCNHDAIKAGVDKAIAEKNLIPLDEKGVVFTTKHLLDRETRISDLVENSKDTVSAVLIKEKAIKRATKNGLSVDSINDAVAVLQSKSRLSLIEHDGIEGNRDFLKAVLELGDNSGKTVRILSPSNILAHDTNSNIERRAHSLWQWLKQQGKPEVGSSVAGFNYKHKSEIEAPNLNLRKSRDVVVVSDAEKLGSQDLETLLTLTDKSETKVILLHDIQGRQGVDATNPLTILKQAGLKSQQLNGENEFQKNAAKLTLIDERIGRDRHKMIAKMYAAREGSVAIVGAKRDLTLANELIREELKTAGKLSRVEQDIAVLNPVDFSREELGLAKNYQPGMVVRFYDKERHASDWSVTTVNKDRNVVFVTNGDEKRAWNPKSKNEGFTAFKSDKLPIAAGDKLIARAGMYGLAKEAIKSGREFTVNSLDDQSVELFDGRKSLKLNLSDLEHSHFAHNYASTINRMDRSKHENVLVNMKAYALDKNTLTALQRKAKGSLTIVTENIKKARVKMDVSATPKATVMETVLSTAGHDVERIFNDSSVSAIKNDIEKAISALNIKEEKVDVKDAAVNYALEKLSSHASGFSHADLVKTSIVHAIEQENFVIDKKEVEAILNQKQAAEELLMGDHFNDGTRWATKEALLLEKKIVAELKVGQNQVRELYDKKEAQNLLAATTLTKGQKEAAFLATTAQDRFVLVQGYAGTGKTTMFEKVKEMAEAKSVDVLALAPTHRAVKELSSRNIKAQTLQSFLHDNKDTKDFDLKNTLLILDEASMVANQDFHDFEKLVKQGAGRAVISGDIAQHIAIGAGKPFEIAQQSGIIKTAVLDEIVRQKNPNQLKAVKNVVSKDFDKAFELIGAEKPRSFIERKEGALDVSKFDKSIVEINDLNTSEDGGVEENEHPLETSLAEDFLSRSDKVRENTVVIVHTHKDREVVNQCIREGLQSQGIVGYEEIEAPSLQQKNLVDAEFKFVSSYEAGNVVKIDKDYFHVLNTDKAAGYVELKKEGGDPGDSTRFYPEKHNSKVDLEVYEKRDDFLAKGDIVRMTKTDKERGFFANFEYRVADIKGSEMYLQSKDQLKSGDYHYLTLDSSKLDDAHWDYAYTHTGYGVQGMSKQYAIDHEMTYNKSLTNQRSFYISASRPIEHMTIYTNNKKALANKIFGTPGDKFTALDVANELKKDEGKSQIDKSTDQDLPTKEGKAYFDAEAIEHALSDRAESFVRSVLGEPNQRLSSAKEWRYGKKGSFVVKMTGGDRGKWHSFETGEGGSLLGLLQKQTGLSFYDALKQAAGMLGGVSQLTVKQNISSSQSGIGEQDKTNNVSKYALKLADEGRDIRGTLAEKYLKENRGVEDYAGADLKYHPGVSVGRGNEDAPSKYMPAMLAIGKDENGKIACVQATYLDASTGNKADLEIKKRTYSSPKGHHAVLAKSDRDDRITYVAEGVETGLSIKDAVVNEEVITTLGKSNFGNIRIESVGNKVVLCLDNDGVDVTKDVVVRGAAERLIAAGKEVFIAMPGQQIDGKKTDFNDIAQHGGVAGVKSELDKIMSYGEFMNAQELKNKVGGVASKNGVDMDVRLSELAKEPVAKSLNHLSSGKGAQQQEQMQAQKEFVQKSLEKDEREIY